MIKFFGESPRYLLFTDDTNAVVIDKFTNMVDEVGEFAVLASAQPWEKTNVDIEKSHIDLATGALADLQVQVIIASGRMYTIPKSVQAEAKKALEWRKKHDRGGTSVGMNTARTLANGGQIGIRKVRHIAKYFPRHEVDKKAKGWSPGDDGFPSNGRIAWALWGGDAAWSWARTIVERENKKAVRADGYIVESDGSSYEDYEDVSMYDADLSVFGDEDSLFIARTRLDESGIDRLYLINDEGSASVWDDGRWDSLGLEGEVDIHAIDRALDYEDDGIDREHIVIDSTSAMIASAHLQSSPFSPVSIDDLDPEEAALIASAIDSVDWSTVDAVLTAAGETPDSTPGEYTPKERSERASSQVRDKTGKFAAKGSRVVVDGDPSKSGNITRINPNDKTVSVQLDSGETVNVPAASTEKESSFKPNILTPQDNSSRIDVSGILGQPRAPIDRPKAVVSGGLPALTSDQLRQVITDFPAWVKSQRDYAAANGHSPSANQSGKDAKQLREELKKEQQKEFLQKVKKVEKYANEKLILGDLREHPLYKKLFKKNPSYNLYYDYSPLTSAAAAPSKESVEVTPQTSDVQPLYMAIVSPEDPSAVFDLVAVVPASSTSTSPMTYKRQDKKWVKDEQILADLKSPTPPPVVPLDGDNLVDVLKQIDGTVDTSKSEVQPQEEASAVAAAGGLDRNRGNAEKLRRYWTVGRGAAKIRWGAPGDWSRCVRHLSKYMGPRAKGYCNLRHKEVLRMYPATHAKLLHGGRKNFSTDEFIMEQPVYGFDFEKMKNDTVKTDVTPEDLNREIEDINSDHDDLYDHEWEPEDEIISLISEIKDQTDFYEGEKPILSAGGLDRNRGNAEKLRRYWTIGRGALKIRWNTPGDWTRCYRHLMKYMGPRAKGYCSLRHKEMTGVWPGSKFNIGKKNRNIVSSGFGEIDIPSEEQVLSVLYMNARIADARSRVLLAGGDPERCGAAFRIPVVIPEGRESGDGRKFRKGAIEYRELPLPLLWQIKTADGHDGSVVVGRIDHMERTKDGIGNAYGVFDTSEFGKEAERMVRDGFIRGVSADLDRFEASEQKAEDDAELGEKKKKIGGGKIDIDHARVMAVTIVPKPAFQECRIYIEENTDAGESQEENMRKIPDGVYVEEIEGADAEAIVACGIIAGAIPAVPPADWFANPNLNAPTPLTVTDDGRVFGHIAAWHVNHIGMTAGTKPPRSKSKYSYFHTGVVRADDGKDYPVGQLTLAGGHASLEASAMDAARHYDDTGSAIADVRAGEDAYGIWVAGSLRPSATPEQIRALRASAPSGDWRPINGALELVAVCQVNVPGFPIARAYVASGQVHALVAAGAQVLAKMKADPITELAQRVATLEAKEQSELSAKADAAKAKFANIKEQKSNDLKMKAAELSTRVRESEFAEISQGAREKLAEEGKALPDGSYPIRNVSDLKNAIKAYGRASEEDRAKVRRHIIKRANELDKSDLIPENWKTMSASAVESSGDLKARIASAAAEAELASISVRARKRLASEGKALPDGSYPIRNVDDLKNAIKSYGRAKESDRAKVRRHIIKRARGLGKSELIPEQWTTASAIAEDAADLKAQVASAKAALEAQNTEKTES